MSKETNQSTNPFIADRELIETVNSIIKNDIPEKVTIVGVPVKLLRWARGKQYMLRFNFAYEISNDTVTYGAIEVPSNAVKSKRGKCIIDLGAPDTAYSCSINRKGQNTIMRVLTMTASEIQSLYYSNRDKYCGYIKGKAADA